MQPMYGMPTGPTAPDPTQRRPQLFKRTPPSPAVNMGAVGRPPEGGGGTDRMSQIRGIMERLRAGRMRTPGGYGGPGQDPVRPPQQFAPPQPEPPQAPPPPAADERMTPMSEDAMAPKPAPLGQPQMDPMEMKDLEMRKSRDQPFATGGGMF